MRLLKNIVIKNNDCVAADYQMAGVGLSGHRQGFVLGQAPGKLKGRFALFLPFFKRGDDLLKCDTEFCQQGDTPGRT